MAVASSWVTELCTAAESNDPSKISLEYAAIEARVINPALDAGEVKPIAQIAFGINNPDEPNLLKALETHAKRFKGKDGKHRAAIYELLQSLLDSGITVQELLGTGAVLLPVIESVWLLCKAETGSQIVLPLELFSTLVPAAASFSKSTATAGQQTVPSRPQSTARKPTKKKAGFRALSSSAANQADGAVSITEEQLEVPEKAAQLQKMYTAKEYHSSGIARGSILATMCELYAFFPRSADSQPQQGAPPDKGARQLPWLVNECQMVLNEHKKGTAVYKTQDYAAGALQGLSSLLSYIPVTSQQSPERAAAFAYIRETLAKAAAAHANSQAINYKAARRAMGLLCQAESLSLSQLVVAAAKNLLQDLGQLRLVDNSATKYAADEALGVLFFILNKHLVAACQQNRDAVALHEWLYATLMEKVQQSSAPTRSNAQPGVSGAEAAATVFDPKVLNVALKGLDMIMQATKMFKGEKEIRKLMSLLSSMAAPTSEKLYSDITQQTGGPVDRAVLLLTAMSSACCHLEVVQPADMELCMKLADQLLGVYHEQFARQQKMIHGTLLKLIIDAAATPTNTSVERMVTDQQTTTVNSKDNMNPRLAAIAQRLVTVLLSHTLKPREHNALVSTTPIAAQPGTNIPDLETEEPQYQEVLPCWKALLFDNDGLLPGFVEHTDQGSLMSARKALTAALVAGVTEACRSLDLALLLPVAGSDASNAVSATTTVIGRTQLEASATQLLAAPGIGSGARAGVPSNMGATGDEEDVPEPEPYPRSPADMMAFISMSDFVAALLPDLSLPLLAPLLPGFLEDLLEAVQDRPYLPGLHQMVGVAIRLIDKAGLLASLMNEPRDSSVSTNRLADTLHAYITAAQAACRQYTGDLLRWALDALMSIPMAELIQHCIKEVESAPAHHQDTAGQASHTVEHTSSHSVSQAVLKQSTLPLRLGLRMGLGHVPTALRGIDALERWERDDLHTLQASLPMLLPIIEAYLLTAPLPADVTQAAGAGELGDITHHMAVAQETGTETPAESTHAPSQQPLATEAGASKQSADNAETDSKAGNGSEEDQEEETDIVAESGRDSRDASYAEAMRSRREAAARRKARLQQDTLQLLPRLLQWLGRMGPAAALLLARAPGQIRMSGTSQTDDNSSDLTGDGMAASVSMLGGGKLASNWAANGSTLEVPILATPVAPTAASGQDGGRPALPLDALLPRIAHLAASAPDRALRVASAELLHAILLYMVGMNASSPAGGSSNSGGDQGSNTSTNFSSQLTHLLPLVLWLGSSSCQEPVSKQLFSTLAYQLVHWYTRSARSEGSQVVALRDALLAGLCDASDSGLRNHCARLVAEYLHWSCKQTPLGQSEPSGPSHALMRRLVDLLHRPQPSQRLGAALAVQACAQLLLKTQAGQMVAVHYLLPLVRACVVAMQLDTGSRSDGLGVAQHLSEAIRKLMTHCWPQCARDLCSDSSCWGAHALMCWLWTTGNAASTTLELQEQALYLLHTMSGSWFQYAIGSYGSSVGRPGAGVPGSEPVSAWLSKSVDLQGSYEGKINDVDVEVMARLKIEGLGQLEGSRPAGTQVSKAWLKQFMAVLNLACWLHDRRLLKASHVSKQGAPGREGLSLHDAVQSFFSLLPDTESPSAIPEPKLLSKASATVLSYIQVCLALEAAPPAGQPAGLLDWSGTPIAAFLAKVLLLPAELGFRPSQERAKKSVQTQASSLLVSASPSGPAGSKLINGFKAAAQQLLPKLFQECWQLYDSNGDINRLTEMLNGISSLLAIPNVGLGCLPRDLAAQLPNRLLQLAVGACQGGRSLTAAQQQKTGTAAFKLALLVELQLDKLMDVILGSTNGIAVYRAYQQHINRWALFHAQAVVKRLFTAIVSASEQASNIATDNTQAEACLAAAEEVINGLIETVRRNSPAPSSSPAKPTTTPSPAASGSTSVAATKPKFPTLPDVQLGDLLNAIKTNWELIANMAGSTANPTSRALILRLLKSFLTLPNINILLKPQEASSTAAAAQGATSSPVIHTYLQLLQLSTQSTADVTTTQHVAEALELLPHLLPPVCQLSHPETAAWLSSDICEGVRQVLEALPPSSRSLDRSSQAAGLLLRQLRAVIQTLEGLALLDCTPKPSSQSIAQQQQPPHVAATSVLMDALLATFQELGRALPRSQRPASYQPEDEETEGGNKSRTAKKQTGDEDVDMEEPPMRPEDTAFYQKKSEAGHLWQYQLEDRLLLLSVMAWRPAAMQSEQQAVQTVIQQRRATQTQRSTQTQAAVAAPEADTRKEARNDEPAAQGGADDIGGGFAFMGGQTMSTDMDYEFDTFEPQPLPEQPTVVGSTTSATNANMTAEQQTVPPSPKVAMSLLKFCWEHIMSPLPGYSADLRAGLLHCLLLPLLQQAPDQFLIEWLHTHLPVVHATLQPQYEPSTGSHTQLVQRLAGYLFVQMMYKRLDKTQLDGAVFAGLGIKNADFMKTASRDFRTLAASSLSLASELASRPAGSDPATKLAARAVRSAAWAAAVELCVRTQSQTRFFTMLLQSDAGSDPASGPWSHFFSDHQRPPNFTLFNKSGTRGSMALEQQLHSMQQAVRAVEHQLGPAGLMSLSVSATQSASSLPASLRASLAYGPAALPASLSAASLAASQAGSLAAKLSASQYTLSEDVQTEAIAQEVPSPSNTQLTAEEQALLLASSTPPDSLPYLEDELDIHPCMLPLVRLLEKLAELSPGSSSNSSTMSDMPDWMQLLYNTFTNREVNRLHRIFLLKAILHFEARLQLRKESAGGTRGTAVQAGTTSSSPFAQFAPVWFPAIVDCLIYGESSQGRSGEGSSAQMAKEAGSSSSSSSRKVFHYVLRELCRIIVTSWGKLFERQPGAMSELKYPAVKEPAEKLLSHLIQAAPNKSSRIADANIQFIRTMLVLWRSAVVVSGHEFTSQLEPRKTKAALPIPDTRATLQLLLIVMTHGQGRHLLTGLHAEKLLKQLLRPLASPTVPLPAELAYHYGRALGAYLQQADALAKRGVQLPLNPQTVRSMVTDAVIQLAKETRTEPLVRIVQGSAQVDPSIRAGNGPADWPDIVVLAYNHLLRRFSDMTPRDRVRTLQIFRRKAPVLLQLGLLKEISSQRIHILSVGAEGQPIVQHAALQAVRALLQASYKLRKQVEADAAAEHLLSRRMEEDPIGWAEAMNQTEEEVASELQQRAAKRARQQEGLVSETDVMKMLSDMAKVAVLHPDTDCRREFLGILGDVCKANPSWASQPPVQQPLLALLADSDGVVRAAALEHWHTILPEGITERMQALVRLVATPLPTAWQESLQQRWQAVAAALLVRRVSDQHGSIGGLPLFTSSLGDCVFTDFPISTQLFATQPGSMPAGIQQRPGVLQATLSTMPRTARGGYSGSISISLSQAFSTDDYDGDTQLTQGVASSGTFASPTKSSQGRSYSSSSQIAGRGTQDVAQLQTHIPAYKGSGARAGILKARYEAAERRRKVAKESAVGLLRKYRVGELPDVQSLRPGSFVRPLLQIVDRDAESGTQLIGVLASLMSPPLPTSTTVVTTTTHPLNDCLAAALAAHGQQATCAAALLHACYMAGPTLAVQPEDICFAAQASGDIQTGILQLESRIMYVNTPAYKAMQGSRGVTPASRAVQAGSSVSEQLGLWSAASELYAGYGDTETRVLVEGNLLSRSEVLQAADSLMTSGRQSAALQRLRQLLSSRLAGSPATSRTAAAFEQSLAQEGVLECLESLGEWSELNSEVKSFLGGHSDSSPGQSGNISLLNKAAGLEKRGHAALRRLVRSEVFTLEASDADDNERQGSLVTDFVKECQRNTELGQQIIKLLPSDAALAQLITGQNKLQISKAVTGSMVACVQAYRGLHPLSSSTRLSWLGLFQPLSELCEVIETVQKLPLVDNDDEVDMEDDVRNSQLHEQVRNVWQLILNTWAQRNKMVEGSAGVGSGQSVSFGGATLAYNLSVRFMAVKHFISQEDSDDQLSKSARSQLLLSATRNALQNAELDLASRLVKECQALTIPDSQPTPQLSQLPTILAAVDVSSTLYNNDPNDSHVVAQLKDAWKVYDAFEKAGGLQGVAAHVKAAAQLARTSALQALSKVAGEESHRWPRMTAAYISLTDAINVLPKTSTTSQGVTSSQGDGQQLDVGAYDMASSNNAQLAAAAHLQLALCCHAFCEAGQTVVGPKLQAKIALQGGLQALVVRHLLAAQALRGVSSSANQVPLLLQYLEQGGAASQQEVLKGWSAVNTRCWLPWLPQLLTLLCSPTCGQALLPLLQQLCTSHPQRVYLPLSVLAASRSWSVTENVASEQGTWDVSSAITNLLMSVRPSCKLLQELVTALDSLTPPLLRWDWFAGKMRKLLSEGKRQAAVDLFTNQALPSLFPATVQPAQAAVSAGAPAQRSLDRSLRVNDVFTSDFKDRYLRAFGADGSRIPQTVQQFDAINTSLFTPADKERLQRLSTTRTLAHYSSWFQTITEQAAYKADAGLSRTGAGLLLPLTGTALLAPESDLPYIVGFEPVVDVFRTKQQPKRMGIHCDDFTTRSHIVKGAEDLRLDQRIQQLFGAMNAILGTSPSTAQRGLQVQTYDVVPLTPGLGIIQYVGDTVSLERAIIPQHISREKHQEAIEKNWLQYIGGNNAPRDYMRNIQTVSRDQVEAVLSKVHAILPRRALRAAILQWSGSAHSFLASRDTYIRSLAAVSICGWICGVGDRHPSNLLIATKTGQLVPIDFGIAFGAATTHLPIPELVPFRLTQQLLGVLDPLPGTGLLAPHMTALLAALQSQDHGAVDLLGALLRLVQQEPIMDWMKEAKQQQDQRQAGLLSGSDDSQPAQPKQTTLSKVDIALLKLKRAHPSDLMLKELQRTRHLHPNSPYAAQLQAIVSGVRHTVVKYFNCINNHKQQTLFGR